jgi:maleylpyruvate isomerase
MTPETRPDPQTYLAALAPATGDLLADVGKLDDAAMREPSTLPGWTKGHVLTHVARNAEGSVHLLTWARTGVRQDEYVSMAMRGTDIEAGATRSGAELIEDVGRWSESLVATAEDLTPDQWATTIQWAAGEFTPAAIIPVARLGEVLLHHRDLAIGFDASGWPSSLLAPLFDRYLSLTKAPDPVPFRLEDDDGRSWPVGTGTPLTVVSGPTAWLLAWLTRRSEGEHLSVSPPGPLPDRPVLP